MPPMTTDRDELIGPPMSEAIAADHAPGVGSAKGPASRASRGEGMREDIEFNADGVTLRGWFYLPDGADSEVPCIVMAHGFSAIKEMHLDDYADVFCDAGLACVVYDNRGFGAPTPRPASHARRSTPGSRSATT